MAMLFDIHKELAEALLPSVVERVPGPAEQGQQAAFAVRAEVASVAVYALLTDPVTERITVVSDFEGPWHDGMAVLLDVGQQVSEALLPLASERIPRPTR